MSQQPIDTSVAEGRKTVDETTPNDHGQGLRIQPATQHQPAVYWSVLHHKNVEEATDFPHHHRVPTERQSNVSSDRDDTIPTNIDVLFDKQHSSASRNQLDVESSSIPKVVNERQPLFKEVSSRSAITESGYYGSITAPPTISPPTSPIANANKYAEPLHRGWSRVREMVETRDLFIRHIPEGNEEGSLVQSLSPSHATASRLPGKWSDFDDVPYELTLRECLFLTLLLLAIGVLAYSFIFERWSILSSLYFTTVILTTVGYGDLTPSSPAGKLFAAVFALGGIVILGLALGVVGSRLVEAEIQYTEKMKAKTTRALEAAFTVRSRHGRDRRGSYLDSANQPLLPKQDSEHSLSSLESLDSVGSRDSMYSMQSATDGVPYRSQTRRKRQSHLQLHSFWTDLRYDIMQGFNVIQRYLPGFLPMLIGAFIMARLEEWGWVDAVYYCVVTATTIGFGDLSPKHSLSKLFAVLFIPIAVAAMGYILGSLASFIVEQRREDYHKKLWTCDLKLEDLEALDTDHDGAGE